MQSTQKLPKIAMLEAFTRNLLNCTNDAEHEGFGEF